MALDSDIHSAGNPLQVRFIKSTTVNNYKSQQEGRPIVEDIILTEVRIPGNNLNVVCDPTTEYDKVLYPREWAHFMSTQGEGELVSGTPLSELPGVSKAMAENLRYLRFHTIEQFAAASDQTIQSLSMQIGMDSMALRAKCQRYLSSASDNAASTRLEQELVERDAKLAAMEGMMKQMQETLAAQQEMIALQEERRAAEDKPAKDKAA